MVTKADYPKDEVEACLSVMVEVMTVLGEFRDSIALVGGWVPYFLFSFALSWRHSPISQSF